MIRVCIVDDQALIRSGLRALLGLFDGLLVTGEAADGEAALASVLAEPPEVLLLDVRMPKLSGVQVVQRLAEMGRLPATLLLTTFEDDVALVEGLRAGARGFLLKGVTAEVLVEAIRTVAEGGSWIQASVANLGRAPTDETWRREAQDIPDSLTPREQEVLRLMARGISNQQIAMALRLQEGTVRNHVSSILSKLGVRDRTRAVLYALERRLV